MSTDNQELNDLILDLINLSFSVNQLNVLKAIAKSYSLAVEDIAAKVNKSHQNTSSVLMALKKKGVVNCVNRGRFHYYSINNSQLRKILLSV